MFRPSVFLKAMRDQRWMVLGLGIGGALMAAFVLGVYPSYREALRDFELPPAVQALIGDVDIASATGFVSAEFFSWIPILLVVYAIVQGTGVLAGEESNGTLDLLLAQPISRARLFIEKAASIIAGALAIVVLILPGWIIPYGAVDMDVGLGRLLAATVAMVPITLAFAALSLLAGCLLPTRRDAASALTALAVISYFVNSLGQAVALMEPLRPASLFFYFRAEKILVTGVDPLGIGVLLGVTLAAGGLAVALFQRRDIGVVLGEGLLERLRRLLAAAGFRAAREGASIGDRG